MCFFYYQGFFNVVRKSAGISVTTKKNSSLKEKYRLQMTKSYLPKFSKVILFVQV